MSAVNYGEIWGAFGKTRKDQRAVISLELTKRDFQLLEFGPVLNLAVTKNNSSIDLFEYTRIRTQISLTRIFDHC
ncbi:MAG: DUF560 domain-containing protein [Opitutaceae bacterium]|nr:DUF560 domain-containing protein [Opitutaceae bacterium]